MSSKDFRGARHTVPLAGLCLVTVLLLSHTILSPTETIGMANTDTEGTLWWVWSQCEGLIGSGRAHHIAYPEGFDVSRFATYNLIDQWRIFLAKSRSCSFESTIILFSLLPVISFFSNLIAGYFLGWQFFRSRACAFLFTILAIASSEVLLTTRTPLANNILVPGLLALGCIFRQYRVPSSANFQWAGMFLGLQMLSNAYNGFVFSILAAGFAIGILWGTNSRPSRALIQSWPLVVGTFGGSLPLIGSQIYLFTDRLTGEQIRPVQASDQLLDPLGLISRPYHWVSILLPDAIPRPEAGWVSLPVVIGSFAAVVMILRGNRLLVPKRWISLSLAMTVLITLVVYRFPNFSMLSDAYFAIFFPLRGVGNYVKTIPLLLSFVAVAAFQVALAQLAQRTNRAGRLAVIVLVVSVAVLDSVPRSRTFYERNSLAPVEDFYEQIPGSGETTISAHYPDFTYDREWGFPIRYIQLAQMFTGDTLANGRDFVSRYDAELALPTPVDDQTLSVLLKRGVNRVYLHRNLMVPGDFYSATHFLTKKRFVRTEFVTEVSDLNSEILRPLDVVIFDLLEK